MDCVCKGSACVKGGKRGEGATLVAMEEANVFDDSGEQGGNNSFQDLRNGLAKNNDAE